MSYTLNTKAYAMDTFLNPNRVGYVGPDNAGGAVDTYVFGRTAPKATPTFRGMMKSESKLTMTQVLDDSTSAAAIITVNASLPVGVSEAGVDDMIAKVAAWVSHADFKSLIMDRVLPKG